MKSHKEALLLENAYKTIVLKESIKSMTLDQIETVLENATEAELDVVEELMSGLGNVFKGARDGIKRGAQAVGGAIQGAGQAVAGAARGAGRAVKAGTQQVGQNVKNMYQTGEAEKAAQQRVEQIKQYITGLEQLLAQHAASGASGRGLDPAKIKTYTLGQLLKVINQKAYTTGKAAAGARDNGFFGGVGGAATSAYKNG